MEFVVLAFVVITVLTVGALLFCLWTAVAVIKWIARLVAWAIWPKGKAVPIVDRQRCHNANCRGDNPEHARFCRRCGRPLAALMRLVDARAA